MDIARVFKGRMAEELTTKAHKTKKRNYSYQFDKFISNFT